MVDFNVYNHICYDRITGASPSMKLTDKQKKWFYREYEDFSFRGYDLWMEVATDNDVEAEPAPNLIVQINEIHGPGLDLIGEEADKHFTPEEIELLVKEINNRLGDETFSYRIED
jgi:hypothetical protein